MVIHIVSNLIHEPVHAFIEQTYYQYLAGYIDSATVISLFPIYWDFFTHPLPTVYLPPTSQHNIMASLFIDSISNVIRYYYRGGGTASLKDSISNALAWGGLDKTNVWNAKPANTKCFIASINLAARDTSLHGVTPGMVGISCGHYPNSRYDSMKLAPPCH